MPVTLGHLLAEYQKNIQMAKIKYWFKKEQTNLIVIIL